MIRTLLARSTLAAAAAAHTAPQTIQLHRLKHTLPKLPYEYNVSRPLRPQPCTPNSPLTTSSPTPMSTPCRRQALEPHISAQIMEIHYSKHHNTYVNNLNSAEETLSNALAKNDVKATIASQSAIKFNGGGHVNHSLFWLNLAPEAQGGGKLPDGQLKSAIDKQYGSLNELKKASSCVDSIIEAFCPRTYHRALFHSARKSPPKPSPFRDLVGPGSATNPRPDPWTS